MSKNDQLIKFHPKLQEWLDEGNKILDIKHSFGNLTIYCYDCDENDGIFVKSVNDIPTKKELKERKRKAAEAVLSSLN